MIMQAHCQIFITSFQSHSLSILRFWYKSVQHTFVVILRPSELELQLLSCSEFRQFLTENCVVSGSVAARTFWHFNCARVEFSVYYYYCYFFTLCIYSRAKF